LQQPKCERRCSTPTSSTDAEVREALGTGFPKHPLHKIACIGALIAIRQPEGWRIDALGAPHIDQRTEAKLISDFMEKISELLPQLITFNGHSFDLPVLRYRAMVNRISAGGLQVWQYFHRYTDDALDLCDALASYVPTAKVKLDVPVLDLPDGLVRVLGDGWSIRRRHRLGQFRREAVALAQGAIRHVVKLPSQNRLPQGDGGLGVLHCLTATRKTGFAEMFTPLATIAHIKA
jgi:hypothetical protein